MERRDMIRFSAVGGVGLLLAGGRWVSQLHARSQLQEELLKDADAILTHKALVELRVLPQSGQQEIRTWFHGPCLNADAFAAAVTSAEFQSRLNRCDSQDLRRQTYLLEFTRCVTSTDAVMSRVDLINRELGRQLDLNWEAYCTRLGGKWDVHLREYGVTPDLSRRCEPLIRRLLEASIHEVENIGTQTAWGAAAESMGESALKLIAQAVVFGQGPVASFLVRAVDHLFQFHADLVRRQQELSFIRKAVANRLALLGNRIGDELAADLRACITRLHAWQEQAVHSAVEEHVIEAVPAI